LNKGCGYVTENNNENNENKQHFKFALSVGTAVAICIMLTNRLSFDSPFYSSIAAIITMQIDYKQSFVKGILRVLGTVMGAVLAMFLVALSINNPIIIGLGITSIVYITKRFSIKGIANVAGIVFVAIMFNIRPSTTPLNYAMFRVVDTFLGVMSSTVVSYLFHFDWKQKGKMMIDKIKKGE
jgi:uncharacterized membrane protein YgaE (UPF0421/DUF939 family)